MQSQVGVRLIRHIELQPFLKFNLAIFTSWKQRLPTSASQRRPMTSRTKGREKKSSRPLRSRRRKKKTRGNGSPRHPVREVESLSQRPKDPRRSRTIEDVHYGRPTAITADAGEIPDFSFLRQTRVQDILNIF